MKDFKAKLRVSYIILLILFSFFIFNLPPQKKESLDSDSKPLASNVPIMVDWNKTWGGLDNDYGEDMIIDKNGDIYCVGQTFSFSNGENDVCLVKYNHFGEQEWNATWGGSAYDLVQGVTTDLFGNIYVSGYTRSYGAGNCDYFLLKYNQSGSLQWYRTFGGSANDLGGKVVSDSQGNTYILGTSESFGPGGRDACLVKYNSSGNQEWYRTWGGSSSDFTHALVIDSQDNIYFGGDTYIDRGGYYIYDLYIVKYNSSGHLLWAEILDASERDRCRTLALDSNEDLICGGNKDGRLGPQTQYQLLLLKYDQDGNQIWNNSWSIVDGVRHNTMVIDSLDNIYIGYSNLGARMAKFNSTGQYEWNILCQNSIKAIDLDSDDNAFVFGSKGTPTNAADLSLFKYKDALFMFLINSTHPENLFEHYSPQFNITFFEPDIDTTWYTLNGGKKIFYTGTTGIINQIEWESCNDGLVYIDFFANTTEGYTVSHGTQVIKDTLVPEIEILKPLADQSFGNSIIKFELNIIEVNLISIWYNLNDGNNITIYGSNGTIDQTAWNHCPVGPVKVTFFVNDIADNEISESVYLNHTDNILGYVNLSRFIIDNIGGGTYTWEEAILRPWCSGSGTLLDPYLITGVEIDGKGGGNCLEIRNSDVYFRIENSTFYNAGDAGIKLVTASNGVIYGNELRNNGNRGIYFYEDCDYNIIENNIIRSNTFNGIDLARYCDYNVIARNQISGQRYAAVSLYNRCTRNDIIFNQNSGGIEFQNNVNYNNISHNTFSGLSFQDYCEHNLVWKNVISGGGGRGVVFVSGWCRYNNFKENIVKDSGVIGFQFDYYCDSNTVQRNVIFHCDSWAVYIQQYSDGNSIINNAFIENDNNDVYRSSNSHGNTVSGNLVNEDLYENNDAFGSASLITSESTHYLAARDNDWFKTYVNRGYTLEIQIARANLRIELYSQSGGLLESSTSNSLTYNVLTSGYYYIKISMYDYSYVMSLTTYDAAPPIITITAPFEGGFYNDTAPMFDVEIYDLDLDSMWYSINFGINHSFITNSTLDSGEWDDLPEGQSSITFYANDTLGYEAYKTVSIYKDIHIPLVNVISPINNQLLGLTAPAFVVEMSDLYLDTMWYTLDGGLTNVIFTENGTFDQTEWDKLINGSITIEFYVNDSIGNLVSYSITCWLDGYNPSVLINNPLSNQLFGRLAPNFDVDISDVNLDSKWYTLNGGSQIIISDLTGTITQEAWDICGNGTVLIRFYANDTTGNIAYHEIVVLKDIIAPEIVIISPQSNYLSGNNTIGFNLTIHDNNYDSTWYCLNSGINYTLLKMTGIIDQAIWDTYGNGTIQLRFYSNDTIGNLAFTEVTIRKDIIPPDINIIIPTQNSSFSMDAPNFALLINEGNLDKIWYTIRHVVSNLQCSTSGQVEKQFWDLIADGKVEIDFFANDTLGNIGAASVIIIKDTTVPPPPPPEPNIIPGYSILPMLSILYLISIITIQKYYRNKKKK